MVSRNSTLFNEYKEGKGKRFAQLLNILGKEQKFVDALSTSLGQELLDDLNQMTQSAMIRLLSKEDSIVRAEYNACFKLLSKFSDKINSYQKHLKELNNN